MKKQKYKVGDKVMFTLVNHEVMGTIVEERGPLGLNGQLVYTVAVNFEATDEPAYYNLEESNIERAHLVAH
jgi:hypothetical protein